MPTSQYKKGVNYVLTQSRAALQQIGAHQMQLSLTYNYALTVMAGRSQRTTKNPRCTKVMEDPESSLAH